LCEDDDYDHHDVSNVDADCYDDNDVDNHDSDCLKMMLKLLYK
jgi:hypothetical protein